MNLEILPSEYSICRLPQDAATPDWAVGRFCSITRTDVELSIVCESNVVPGKIKQESGWKGFRISGHLDFDLIGVLSKISGALAKAGVSIFVVSTFGTDYVLVKTEQLTEAMLALETVGYRFENLE